MKIFAFFAILAVANADPIVEDKVYEDLATKGTVTVILHFKGPKTSDLLAKFREEHRPFERTVHHDVLPNILETNANKHQAETLAFLKGRKLSKSSGSDYTQIWMLNQLIVHNADPGLIDEFKKSKEITMIEADREYQLIEASPWRDTEDTVDDDLSEDASIQQTSVQWGVKDVGAPDVWDKNFRGEGVTVGVIDTGIRPSHEILRSRFRSSYGWLDAINRRSRAYDDQGHGTHCAGTIAGTNGYGVAPNATLIACKALSSTGSGSGSGLRTCGQFMLCPTDPQGNNKDCSKKAKIVSNSWGGSGTSTWYNDIVDSWISAGMIAVFANGNEGSDCSTTGSPASYKEAIGVGATTDQNKVASFSSRGPVDSYIKPDIAAPGQGIRSASHRSDRRYATMSGTSMAAPHIAGIAALYANANPDITNDEVRAKLQEGAVPITASGQTCGGISDSDYPNNVVGAGKAYAPAGFE